MGRPMKLKSETHLSEVSCCLLKIIISFHEKTGTPFECFVKQEKKKGQTIAGGCRSNISANMELVTKLLKNDLLEDAIEALEGHQCASCMRLKQDMSPEEKRDAPSSCPDSVAKILKQYLIKKEEREEDKKEEKEKK